MELLTTILLWMCALTGGLVICLFVVIYALIFLSGRLNKKLSKIEGTKDEA